MQAWQRWVRKGSNGLSHVEQEELLRILNAIANARSQSRFNDAVKEIRSLPLYQSKDNVRQYVDKTWLSCSFRWAKAFRVQEADNIVNTNNGVEAQNRVFKYQYLPFCIDKSVYGIAMMIVDTFILESYQSYQRMNMRLSENYRQYHPMVPYTTFGIDHLLSSSTA